MPKCTMSFVGGNDRRGRPGNSSAAELSLLLWFKGHGGYQKKGLACVGKRVWLLSLPWSLLTLGECRSEQLMVLFLARQVHPGAWTSFSIVVFLKQVL